MRACPKCGVQYGADVAYCNTDGTELSDIDAPAVDEEAFAARLGTTLGSYRLLEILGEGGMGCVYLAEHTRLGRKVALKILHPDYASNPSAVRRFFVEARAVNQIRHANIIEITDFCEDERDDRYYIMELLEGKSLADEQAAAVCMPLPRGIKIARQITDALVAVHAAGIVHRDLKPDNIFLIEHAGRKDFVKLLDFGVAKLTTPLGEKPLDRTAVGAILGTPEYMSPEQVSGRSVDFRTDIYALGVILYELATGIRPLQAKTFGEMVIKHLTVTPPKPSRLKNLPQDIPPEFENLILHCLEKEPQKRPESMVNIRERLQLIAQDLPDDEVLIAPRRRLSKRAGVAMAALGALVVAGLAAMTFSAKESAEQLEIENTVAKLRAVPASVELTFDSEPAGATVYRAGTEEPLGVTPFALSLDRSDSPDVFEFRLADHISVTKRSALTADATVAVTLKPAAARPPAAKTTTKPKRKRRPRDKRGTIDPFAQ